MYVKSGVYPESGLYITSSRSGTSSNPTRIQAYPEAVVTIRGDGINTGRLKITGCSYLTFDGFIVTNFNQGIYVEASTNITVQNCTVHNIGQEGIHVNGNSVQVTIQSCTVHDTGKWIYNGEGIYVGTGSAGPVDNTSYVTIRSNTVFHTGTAPGGGEAIELKPGTHDCLVDHNIIYDVQTGSGTGAIEINESRLGVQHWDSDPHHIVRNNILHNLQTAIRVGSGCLVYNNLIYAVTNGNYGVLLDNNVGDSYLRRIYHNTIKLPGTTAVRQIAGIADIRNNLGPSSSNNVAANAAYFVNAGDGDYHLVSGSVPIDAGVDLSSIVPTDLDGNRRTNGLSSDLGAYEFAPHQLYPPENLRILK